MNWPVTRQRCITFLLLRDSVWLLDLLNSTLHDGQLVQFVNFAICSSFSAVIGLSLEKMTFILTCSRLRYKKNESIISPRCRLKALRCYIRERRKQLDNRNHWGCVYRQTLLFFQPQFHPSQGNFQSRQKWRMKLSSDWQCWWILKC